MSTSGENKHRLGIPYLLWFYYFLSPRNMSILAYTMCPSWMRHAGSQSPLSTVLWAGRVPAKLVPGRTKGSLPVLEWSQNPSRKHVLGDISFGFHCKAASTSLVAPVNATARWCPMVQSLNLSWHKHIHPPGKGSGEGEDAVITSNCLFKL